MGVGLFHFIQRNGLRDGPALLSENLQKGQFPLQKNCTRFSLRCEMWRLDPIIGMFGTMLVAYGLDRWILSARERGIRTLTPAPYLLSTITADLILAVLLLGLAWLILYRDKRSKVVAFCLFSIGLGITMFPVALSYVPGLFAFLFTPEFRALRVTLIYSAPNSHLISASAFISMTGLLGLVPFRREWLSRVHKIFG